MNGQITRNFLPTFLNDMFLKHNSGLACDGGGGKRGSGLAHASSNEGISDQCYIPQPSQKFGSDFIGFGAETHASDTSATAFNAKRQT